MSEQSVAQSLKIVDAFDLDDELRSILRPGEMVKEQFVIAKRWVM